MTNYKSTFSESRGIKFGIYFAAKILNPPFQLLLKSTPGEDKQYD